MPDPSTGETPQTIQSSCADASNSRSLIVPASYVADQALADAVFEALALGAGDGAGRSPSVATYFLSGAQLHVCAFARVVELDGSPLLWRRQVVQAWQGMIDPTSAIHVYVVTPSPRTNSDAQQFVAYILVVQHPLQDHSALLVTRSEEDGFTHVAQFMSSLLTRRVAIWSGGLARRCFAASAVEGCRVSYAHHLLNDEPLQVPDGAGILMELFPLQHEGWLSSSSPGNDITGHWTSGESGQGGHHWTGSAH